VGLGGSLREGTYLVAYRVISADSHVVSGAFSFSLGAPTASPSQLASAVSPPSNDGWKLAGDVVRAFGYAGLLLAVGGIVFLLAVLRDGQPTRSERWLLTMAALVAMVAFALTVVVQTVVASGLGGRAATDWALLEDTLRDRFGTSVIVRLTGLLLLVAGLWVGARQRGRGRWTMAAVGALVAVISFPLTGHPRSTPPRALIFVSDAVHVLAASIWIGGLVMLVAAVRRRRDDRAARKELASIVGRFSNLARAAVVALVAAGLVYAWKQTGSFEAITSTRYGGLLIAKVAVAVVVLGIGAYNNRVLVPAIEQSWGQRPVRTLGRTVRAELLALAGVVALTAVLVNATPAREAVAASSGPYFARLDLDETHQLDVELVPNRVGPNEAHLNIYEDGFPADIAEQVTVRLRLPARGIGPLEHEATRLAPGHWVVRLDDLTLAGEWQLDVVVRVSDFDQFTTTSVVDVSS
jgi:copper transport protein